LSKNIAVAGKGGNGKTSITTLIIRYLLDQNLTPILAVDADANANLGESLGLKVADTLGSIVASFNEEKISIPQSMTKEAYLQVKLNGAMVESKGLDLLTMGRGEGAECYCYPNLLLRKFMDELSHSYKFVVMDNEAGMEHLSRRTTQNIDELLLISDHSMKGIRTVARLRELVAELKLSVKRMSIVINAVGDGIDPVLKEEMNKLGIEPTTTIPFDEQIREYDLQQKPLSQLPDTSRAVAAVNNLMEQLLHDSKTDKKRG
jgi:CO dehydrogenase maturation factor